MRRVPRLCEPWCAAATADPPQADRGGAHSRIDPPRGITRQTLIAVGIGMATLTAVARADGWVHPAGLLDVATIKDMKRKVETFDWARTVVAALDAGALPWLKQPLGRIEELMPKRKVSVYWLMICPTCRERLTFNPFSDQTATCGQCKQTLALDQPSPATPPDSYLAGTLYDGWGCSYLQAMAGAAQNLALLHALGKDRSYAARGADILKLFARYIKPLPVKAIGAQRVIWTYNIEGDVSLLARLAPAYELLRGIDGLFAPQDHREIQNDLLKHWVDSVVRIERDSSLNHNSMHDYLGVVALVGCAIEDADYVDWAFGCRMYSPQERPNHRGMFWLTENNYKPDGGFWGLCSAYHLYALGPNCQTLVFGHRLSRQMPDLFPPTLYDSLDPGSPRCRTLRRAIQWFTAQAFPDLTMAPFGDMGGRVSLETYPLTAEIGYRYLGVHEVGSYRNLREGGRSLTGLIFGADAIVEKPWPYRSANLSSGYVALRRQTNDNRLYAGLNALLPGEGHQHADRLNLITYSRDRMLAGEKRTRYEDPEQRTYSGASYAHNTVTVDQTSQVHGNELTGDRIPRIDTFLDLPAGQVAEAHGDNIYKQTRIYRRLLCQFDEYLLDIFRVEGGKTHDWFYHGVGDGPELSMPMQAKTGFEPALYVVRGEPAYMTGSAEQGFTATWRLPAEPAAHEPGRRRDVFSRVTLAGAATQKAYALSTFPDPGKHSLMVRQSGESAVFVAVHEACFEGPVAIRVRTLPTDAAAAVEITHADGGRRLAIYESGSTADGLRLAGRFGMIELDSTGRLRSLILARGTRVSYGDLDVATDREASLSITCDGAGVRLVSCPPIAFETLEAAPVYAMGEDAAVSIRIPVQLSPTGQEIRGQVVAPGQRGDGPVHKDLGS